MQLYCKTSLVLTRCSQVLIWITAVVSVEKEKMKSRTACHCMGDSGQRNVYHVRQGEHTTGPYMASPAPLFMDAGKINGYLSSRVDPLTRSSQNRLMRQLLPTPRAPIDIILIRTHCDERVVNEINARVIPFSHDMPSKLRSCVLCKRGFEDSKCNTTHCCCLGIEEQRMTQN